MCITLCGFCGKVDVNLWKNYFYVFGLGEKGNFFQSATLYLRFSESKRRAKDFRRSNAAAKARLRGGFRAPKPFAPPKTQKSLFRTVHEAVLRNRRATGARI